MLAYPFASLGSNTAIIERAIHNSKANVGIVTNVKTGSSSNESDSNFQVRVQ